MRVLVLILASCAIAFGQFSNAKTLAGIPPCSATVTTNCIPAKDASGNFAIATTVLGSTGITSRSAFTQTTFAQPNTLVTLGDSITAQGWTADANSTVTDKSFVYWTNYILKQAFVISHNAGVNGNTTAQMLARLESDVFSYRPKYLLVMGGVNDNNADVASATQIANLSSIYTQALARGITVIACTTTPNGYLTTAGRKAIFDAVNTWIKAQTNPNIIVVDTAAAIQGADAYTPATGTTYDDVHPSTYGAYLIGKKIADAFSTLHPVLSAHPITTSALPLLNSTMTGTAGSESGGATGDTADSWTLIKTTGTVAGSKVARTDGAPGEWQQIDLSGANAAARLDQEPAFGGNLVAGDQIQLTVEVQPVGDWSGVSYIRATVGTGNSGGFSVITGSSAATGGLLTNPGTGFIQSQVYTVPATVTVLIVEIRFGLIASGTPTGSVRIGRVEIKKVNPTGEVGKENCGKYTVPFGAGGFQLASTTNTVPLFTLPQHAKVTGVTTKHSASFSDGAGAMTEVGVTVGDSSSATAYNGNQNIGEATAAGDAVFTDSGALFKSTTMAAGGRAVNAYFTATGANFGNGTATSLTAGSVDFRVCWVRTAP